MIDVSTASLAEIQAAIIAGETLTADEYRSVIERIRTSRSAAATASKGRKKSEAATVDFDLNAELDALFAPKVQ